MAPRVKPKPKSRKAKVTHKMSSKRRLSRMGKQQKKGHKGIIASYLTRAQAVRRLRITLKDFRRLCILKGVYPRDPKKKASGKDKAYYHIKDVGFLAHEPLLDKFRQIKAFMKKVRKALGRGDPHLARQREQNRPRYTLDHLVRERYPRFADALSDLDDALSLVHLFAALPADGPVVAERTERCRQLTLEWQYWVTQSHALSKVFVSIKGIYFQADVMGQPVTWIIPHSFTQVAPAEIDFRIMLTFLEFYETLLKFVLYKLYHGLDLLYPPTLDHKLDEQGVYMAAVRGLPMGGPSAESAIQNGHPTAKKEAKGEARKVKGLESKLAQLAAGEGEGGDESEDELPEGVLRGALTDAMEEVLEGPDEELSRRQKEEMAKRVLFKGLRFFLSREVPINWVHLIISSFGGVVGWESEGSPFSEEDKSITHHVIDRPTVRSPKPGREYVQPQWIFDSINARILLPLDMYRPAKTLPPHLSPFVDDAKEGYIPAYRRQLDMLRGKAAASSYGAQTLLQKADEEGGNGKESQEAQTEALVPDEEGSEEDGGEGVATAQHEKRKLGQSGQDDARQMAESMLSRKKQRLYRVAKQREQRRREKMSSLVEKSRKLDQEIVRSGPEKTKR